MSRTWPVDIFDRLVWPGLLTYDVYLFTPWWLVSNYQLMDCFCLMIRVIFARTLGLIVQFV